MTSRTFRMTCHHRITGLRQGGYSLIELLIVVSILAIVATLAQTSWQNHLVRVRRTEATAWLLRASAAQESFFSATHHYAIESSLPLPQGLGLELSENGWYKLSVESATADGFVMAARPAPESAQAIDEECRIFTIDQIGRRGSAPAAPGVCWR